MIATTQLATRLVRRHRDLYAGVIVTVVLTMLIGGAEVTLASDFSDPSRGGELDLQMWSRSDCL